MRDRSNPDPSIANTRQLAHGSAYVIRASRPDDRELLMRCFAALSPGSRRKRFFIEKPTLTQGDQERLLRIDGHDHLAFVAVRVDAEGRELEPLGFARCHRLEPGGKIAELAMATVDEAQGLGVGFALLVRLIRAARDEGISHFWFEVLAENHGMRRLAHLIGAKATWGDEGNLEYDCLLAEALGKVPAHSEQLTPSNPTQPEPEQDWPWYLDPALWLEPWTETWRSELAEYLSRLEAANEDADHWLAWQVPFCNPEWRWAA